MPRHRLAAIALGALLVAGCSSAGERATTAGAPRAEAVPSAELVAAQEAVGDAAPRLESAYRGDPYPQTLEEVLVTLEGAGVELGDDLRVAGYAFDPDTVEFTLCVEHDDGAWATYDTAPMSLREGGESGGCPDL